MTPYTGRRRKEEAACMAALATSPRPAWDSLAKHPGLVPPGGPHHQPLAGTGLTNLPATHLNVKAGSFWHMFAITFFRMFYTGQSYLISSPCLPSLLLQDLENTIL